MLGHLAEPALHAVEPTIGRGVELLSQLDPGGLDPFGQACGHLFQAAIKARPLAGLHRSHASVEMRKRGAQTLQGLGGAGLGLAQTLGDTAHHLFDQARRLRAALRLDPLHPRLDGAQGLAGAGLAFVEVVGDLADRAFQGAESFGRTGAAGLGFHTANALGHTALLGGDVFDRTFEPGGHRHMLALGGLDPGQGRAHRMLDAGHRQPCAAFRDFQALAQTVQRQGDAAHLVGRMLGGFDPGRRVLGPAQTFEIGGERTACEVSLGDGVFRTFIVKDHSIEPFAQGHARPPGEVFRDLPGFGVDALDAPWRRRRHSNRSPTRVRR